MSIEKAVSTDKSLAVCRSLNLIYPPFRDALMRGIAAAQADGHSVDVFETYRSPARQDYLYAQGRGKSGEIVTHAQGWKSWHQYGVAADIAMLRPGGKWAWDFDPSKLQRYFVDCGLKWGGHGDGPHFEHRGLPPIASAETMIRSHGLLRFWLELETR